MAVIVGLRWWRLDENVPNIEYPYKQNIYRYYGNVQDVENVYLPKDVHDLGPCKRMSVYTFLAKHLKLNIAAVRKNGAVDETDSIIFMPADLAVWNEAHPLPGNAVLGDAAVGGLLGGESVYRIVAATIFL